jgi:hypothetical protein
VESRQKSVFLVEGKHDPPLISALLVDKYKIAQLNKVCLFYNNDGNTKMKYGQETDVFKEIFTYESPFRYAIKSEGGKSFVLPLLGSIIEEIVREPEEVNAHVYCMVDLDGNTERQQLEDIITVIKLKMKGLSIKYDISRIINSSFLGTSFYKSYYEIKVHYTNEVLILPLTVLLANPTLESIVAKHCKVPKNMVKQEHVKKFALDFKDELSDLL